MLSNFTAEFFVFSIDIYTLLAKPLYDYLALMSVWGWGEVRWSSGCCCGKERKKIDFRRGLHPGEQVSDTYQHKNRPVVLSLQSAYLLKGQKRGSQHQASLAIMKSCRW